MPDPEYAFLAHVKDIPKHSALSVSVKNDHKIALYKRDGHIYAIQDRCTHLRIKLSQGEANGLVIECPLHGALFDMRTGKVLQGPAHRDVPVYQLKIEDNKIFIDLQQIPDEPELQV